MNVSTEPRWRLRYHFGDFELYSEWKEELAPVENLAEQLRHDSEFHDVVIERRTKIRLLDSEGAGTAAASQAEAERLYAENGGFGE